MSAESVRAFLASAAPDLEIVELPASSQTHTLSAAWGIRAAQIAKTLALSVGGRAVLAVVCGDSRLDNKKVKAVLGGQARCSHPRKPRRSPDTCSVDICVVTTQGLVDSSDGRRHEATRLMTPENKEMSMRTIR